MLIRYLLGSLLLIFSTVNGFGQSSAEPVCQEIKTDLYRLDRLKAQIREYPGTVLLLGGCIGGLDKQDNLTKLGGCAAACAALSSLENCKDVIQMLAKAMPEENRISEANKSFNCSLDIKPGLLQFDRTPQPVQKPATPSLDTTRQPGTTQQSVQPPPTPSLDTTQQPGTTQQSVQRLAAPSLDTTQQPGTTQQSEQPQATPSLDTTQQPGRTQQSVQTLAAPSLDTPQQLGRTQQSAQTLAAPSLDTTQQPGRSQQPVQPFAAQSLDTAQQPGGTSPEGDNNGNTIATLQPQDTPQALSKQKILPSGPTGTPSHSQTSRSTLPAPPSFIQIEGIGLGASDGRSIRISTAPGPMVLHGVDPVDPQRAIGFLTSLISRKKISCHQSSKGGYYCVLMQSGKDVGAELIIAGLARPSAEAPPRYRQLIGE